MGEEPEDDPVEELDELDFVDPLKRDPDDEDERMPGWDPVVPPVPPEE
jgi:hypothetical protein